MPTTPPLITLSGLLHENNIIIIRDSSADKSALIEQMVELACKNGSALDVHSIASKIQQREQGISTTLDTGLSIPHARVEGLDDFRVVMALSKDGITDPAKPGILVKVIFLFLSPSNPDFFQKHLKLLSVLSTVFTPDFIKEISAVEDPKLVTEKLRQMQL